MFRGHATDCFGPAIPRPRRPNPLPLTSRLVHNRAARGFEQKTPLYNHNGRYPRPTDVAKDYERKYKPRSTQHEYKRPTNPAVKVATVLPEKSRHSYIHTQQRDREPPYWNPAKEPINRLRDRDPHHWNPTKESLNQSRSSRLATVRSSFADYLALQRLKRICRIKPGTRLPSSTGLVRSWRGDPRSFDGQRAYLIAGKWHRLAEGYWTELFHLLRGPPRSETFSETDPHHTTMNYIQVATTPTADSGSSLIFHFDQRRYFFGHLTEGTQRSLGQRKYAMAKMENIFISGQTTWGNTGGMIGMFLTLADVLEGSRKEIEQQNEARGKAGRPLLPQKGPERLEIHGPRNLTHNIATARSFVFRKGMPIRPVEVFEDPRITNPDPSTPDWEDDSIQVWKVPVVADEPSEGRGTSRKRSHEVMSAEDENLTTSLSPPGVTNEQIRKNQDALTGVVENMFNSTWTMDTLHEIKLHDVELPATIFVREDGNIQRYQGPLPGGKENVPNIDVLVRFPWPAATVQSLPPTGFKSTMSVCYVVKNRGRRGKFNPAIAKQHGVQPIQFKLLAAGQTVEGKDGVQITPDMVLGAPMKPSGFAVLDIPSTSAVDSFLARQEWKDATIMENVRMFYWLLGKSVVDDLRIQKFMQERPDVKHVVLAPDVCPNMLSMNSYAVLMAKLRRIDADRFPLLQFDNTTRDLSFIAPNVEAARSGMTAILMPQFKIKDDEIVPFESFTEVAEMSGEVLDLAGEARAAVKDPKFLEEVEKLEQDIPNRDTEIIPLGTGSALPSKYRNVSSTLIRIPQYGNYILDCGENTMGQLRRAFPPEELTDILQNLRCLFISHMHADHHLGTASLVRAWAEATAHLNPRPKLGVVGPVAMKRFLQEHNETEDISMDRVVFRMVVRSRGHLQDQLLTDITRCSHIDMVPVKHCKDSFAGVLAWPSGLKIAYSGDCRPSDKLVEAGKGATLLIHESTFDDDKIGDAKAKNHSTMAEALDVGYRMGARRILLTHFSQRYAKVPIVDKRETESGDHQAVLLAFDQMRVKLGEFRHAEKFLPAIRRYFELNAD